MIKKHHLVQQSAKVAGEAARATLREIQSKDAPQEPQMTDRMLGRIGQAMDGLVVNGATWRAKTMADRGINSEESVLGADFAVVIEFLIDNKKFVKGFLGQSKYIGDKGDLSAVQKKELIIQCEKMLKISPDSFVVIFSNTDIRVVPAVGFGSGIAQSLKDLYSRSIERFLEDFFQCFCGDPDISSPSYDDLKVLHTQFRVASSLGLRLKL